MRTALALAVTLVVGCKTDDAKPAAQRTSGSSAPARDATPTPAAAVGFPTIASSRPLMAPRATPDGDTQLASWCVEAADAKAAAPHVVAALEAAGWTEIMERGTSRIAIGATHGDHRISITIGGVDQACTGVVATATLVRAGAWTPPPPLEDGERIH